MACQFSSNLPSDSTLPRLPDDCDAFDFITKDRYSTVSAVRMSYEKAVQKLSSAGPVFVDRDRRRVWFDELDHDVQCNMINTMTRQIVDKEECFLSMPKGNWSDYEPSKSGKWTAAADAMSQPYKLENIKNSSTTSREVLVLENDLEAPPAITVYNPDILPASSHTEDQRKDSAHSLEQTQVPQCDKDPQTACSPQRGGDSKHRRSPAHRYNPHDLILFTDEFRNAARWTIIGMEDSWHPSKKRNLPTLAEMNFEAGLLESPRLRKVGSARSVLFEGITFSRSSDRVVE